MMTSDCEECENDRYILLGCCSGFGCGCMGKPVQMTNCEHCNKKGDLDVGAGVSEYAPYVEYIGE